jgi:hypothetical protein
MQNTQKQKTKQTIKNNTLKQVQKTKQTTNITRKTKYKS